MGQWDVIIVGGGISGTIAAIASSRCGCKTLLIEQYGFLGGMLTAAGVGPMMSFHAGEKQVIQGITGELIERMKVKGKSQGHIFDTTGYTYTVTPFDAEWIKHELEEMLLESSGELLYHSKLADVEVKEGKIKSVSVCNKSGITKLSASVYIDATGDGDLSAWAGVDFVKGRAIDGMSQPMTMNLKLRNVNIDKVREYIKSNPEEFPRLKGDTGIIDKASRLSIGGFVSIIERARQTGEISFSRENILFFETNNPGEVIVNTSRLQGHDSTDPWSLTKAEIEGRKQVRELERLLKLKVPGFEQSILECSGPSIGVRSSRQIKGLYTITAEDLVTGKTFDDVIAHGGYPVDIHAPSSNDTDNYETSDFKDGHVYSIPYRALVNEKVHNLITVGRCISATFEAQGAIRVSPIAGAIGHAGGVGAALAVKSNVPVDKVNIKKLQEKLIEQGAYLEL